MLRRRLERARKRATRQMYRDSLGNGSKYVNFVMCSICAVLCCFLSGIGEVPRWTRGHLELPLSTTLSCYFILSERGIALEKMWASPYSHQL